MKIHYITPFALDKNIGKEYNARISELPDDAWICLRDQDTLPLSPYFGARVAELIENRGCYSLIGCMTNRLRSSHQLHGRLFSENTDIKYHMDISEERWMNFHTKIVPAQSIAGMFMLFPKSLFNEVQFKENSLRFDVQFCIDAADKGYKIGIAQGVYLFHMYRLGSPNPYNDIKHLL